MACAIGVWPDEANVRVLSSVRGRHGAVHVLLTHQLRLLLFNKTVVGAEFAQPHARDQAAFSGMALMQTAAFLTPKPTSVLCLGLGSGTAPAFYASRGALVDVVEHEPAITKAATEHFLYSTFGAGRATTADAVAYIRAGSSPRANGYDVVLSDLFDGANPRPSLSVEHFRRVKSGWLRASGVLALNIVAYRTGPHSMLARSAVRTLREAFSNVQVFVDHAPTSDGAAVPSNLLAFASDGAIRFVPPRETAGLLYEGSVDHLFANFVGWEAHELRAATEGLDGIVLTEDGDEMSALLASDAAAIQQAMHEMLRPLLADVWWNELEDGRVLGEAAVPTVEPGFEHSAAADEL